MPLCPPVRPGRSALCLALIVSASFAAPTFAADPPSASVALSFQPRQKGVEIDVPDKADVANCTVKVERKGNVSGWVVLGPQGQILRRFLDTDGDNVVDQWRYFHNGVEVYRDLDTNANNKMDQARWVNTGGTRWGIDANEDGKIDSWKVLSAEEATRVAVEAMLAGDAALLQTVLIGADDVKALGIGGDIAKQLLDSVAKPAEQIQAATTGSKILTSQTTWMRFDSSSPGVVPADEGKAAKDLFVYENAMAIVEYGDQTGLVQIGEMLRVGDVWKLTQIPKPLEGDTIQITNGGILMQPALVSPDGVPGGISPKMRELLEALQKLDANAPDPSAGVEAFARYNAERAEILAGLAQSADTPEDKEMWTRQFADSVSAAVTTGVYPEGLQKLDAVERQLAKDKADPILRAYVLYRRLFADYNQRLRQSDAEGRVQVQQWWLSQLTSFVDKFPESPDAADALLQLALAEELSNEFDKAAAWYDKLAKAHPDTERGQQAAGALNRLGLKGKPFAMTGAGLKGGTISSDQFKGKVLLVLFWSTACKPCEEDLPLIRALYQQYGKSGFEILGVNLDPTAEGVASYMAKHQMTWPQIHEAGGQDSKPARDFGIVSLPTMILVGSDGKVVSRAVSVAQLKESLPELLKPKQ
ncbi:MAG: TlpA family protein disulfide reductase [Planctomycetota bacterium]|nr:TlpA family protein disulfide reductase [Planctomycetaceae bacterium]MDQ3330279.1 TlpA family protein disulfide reductase [Planctomycetota bacterium]